MAQHLRTSGLGEGVNVALVMSDGAEPFFVSKDKQNIELSLPAAAQHYKRSARPYISEILEKVLH